MEEKAPSSPDFNIGIIAYEGVDLLDVAAPYELFNWMALIERGEGRDRNVIVRIVAKDRATLKTRDGLEFNSQISFKDCPQLNLIWVAGGDPSHLALLMKDHIFLDFLRRQSVQAEYVTSVCEGALLLASAGLLDGYEATTHWAFLPCLKRFPKVRVVGGYPRYKVDGNRVTGGGISSGIDEALILISMISGEQVAKQVQLTTQYNPKPPFQFGDPEQAGTEPAHECPVPGF